MDPIERSFPERDLWMAVIERSVRDYCFFFDNLFQFANNDIFEKKREDRVSFVKAVQELRNLRWFLFGEIPRPFNLQFILEAVYDDFEGMAKSIRQSVSEQFKLHLEQVIASGRHKRLVEYVQNETSAMKAKTAVSRTTINRRRFRGVIN